MTEALSLMWRDASEAPLLMALIVLPTLIALPRLRHSRLATLPPIVLAALLLFWFLHYVVGSTDPGLFWAMLPFLVAFALGLVLAVASWIFPRKQHSSESVDKRPRAIAPG